MGKKKFIDKKKSATFTLVFRDTSAEEDASVPIRQFTRVDGGDSFVPGFSEDDPRSQPFGDEYSDDDEEDDAEEGGAEDSANEGVESDSRFDDAAESEDGEEERVVQTKPKGLNKATVVGTRAAPRGKGSSLPENVRMELIELGFPDDGYDYNKHMRSIASTGAFVPANRAADLRRPDIRAYDASKADVQPVAGTDEEAAASEIIEHVRSSTYPVRKPLSKDGVLDMDILAALENSDGSQFDSADELDDEFVIVASVADQEGQASQPVDNATTSSGRRQTGGASQKQRPDEDFEDFDDNAEEEDDELGDLPQRPHTERPVRLLDEQFETLALNEYDDYDDGELDDDDPDARGHADISQFSSVLTEFQDDKDIYSEKYETIAESHKAPGDGALGSGNNADSVGGKTANIDMVVNIGVEDVVVKKTLELGDRDFEELAVVEVESDEDRDDWDCETVVSTYSNFDNHPAKISAPGLSKLRPKLQDVDKAGIIRLGGKQRLPVDYLPGKGDEDKQDGRAVCKEAVSSGKVPTGPRAGETPAEKKARKALVKEGRREARSAKKTLKLCYKDDSQRAQRGAATMGPNVFHLP